MTVSHSVSCASCAEVEIRARAWIFCRVDPSSDKGYELACESIFQLVHGKEVTFLTRLEGEIGILADAVGLCKTLGGK
ncbi:MAG: hypothetical protein COA42_18620 [Alteromonadaceae bacterium]|nr:MAG: hypothetical protein COA42_18620 [Alteromonadaceae bacterium]